MARVKAHPLVATVAEVLAGGSMLRRGDGIVVGVSGGVDSMVLLDVLARLAPQNDWRLVVAHFNHQLRGAEADADEALVAETSRRLGLPFVVAREDVCAKARQSRISVEMAARECRYRFLAETARREGARHVALAHHADDQVELFFLRLWRGAGTQGLGGMETFSPCPVDRDLNLVRPLLGEFKETLRRYAEQHGVGFREDASNESPDIRRNRIRRQLLPLLRAEYEPAIDTAVLRSMELVRDEGDFVTAEAVRWLNQRQRDFETLHVALQRRVIQLELLANGIVPQFTHVEALRVAPANWVAVKANVLCRRDFAGTVERRVVRSPRLASGESMVVLRDEGEFAYDGVNFTTDIQLGSELPPAGRGKEYFDAEAVGERVVLRHWREGDRFQPIGMASPVKLQDWFVNRKVPKDRRHELVLATTAAGEIFWIEDQRIAEPFKVRSETRRLLQWQWRRDSLVAPPVRGC
jgi:tRNA(Ile)-lysidine synthase